MKARKFTDLRIGPTLPAVAICLCLFKLTYWAVSVTAVWLWGDFRDVTLYHWPAGWPPAFKSHFATFDGYFYLAITDAGYHAGEPGCAFYPLWPLLIRWFSSMTNADPLIVGLVLSNAFSLVAWTVLYEMVRQRWGGTVAKWSVVWLVAFPGSLFYQLIYSESLFLLLIVGLWWALEGGHGKSGCLLAFLLPLTRPIGVFCIVPVLWHVANSSQSLWLERSARWLDRLAATCGLAGPHQPTSHRWRAASIEAGARPFGSVKSQCLVLAPLCGWLCYLAMMLMWTGNPFEGFGAQKHWGVNSIGNLWNLPKFLLGFLNPTTWHEHTGSLLDRCVFLLLLYCLPSLWRLDKDLVVWTCILGILPAISATFSSFTRYVAVAFPVFIALAVMLGRPDRRRVRYGLLATFVVLHVALVWRYVNFRWAG